MTTKEGLILLATKYNKENGWRYGGGARRGRYDHDIPYIGTPTRHSRYYENFILPELVKKGIGRGYVPKHKHNCVCGHAIKENCFIYRKVNDKKYDIRVLGNCCIKRYGLDGRHCQMCDEVHRNWSVNLCNQCRT